MSEPGGAPPPVEPGAAGRPGFAVRVIAPTVAVGAGMAVASTLTASHVNAAGESEDIPVEGAGPTGGLEGFGTTTTTTVQSTTTGGSVETSQSSVMGPDGGHFEPIDPSGGNVLQDGQVDLDPSMLPEGSILVEMVQHVVVTDLPNGQYHIESFIEIKVHQNGEVQTFEKYSDQVVTKQDGTDLIVQQDGTVVVHLDENGNAVVEMDGGLTVTEVPGDPNDEIPEGAVVVVQEQDVTVIDEDDGIGDDTEDPDVFGDFEQDASAIDNPTDGEVDDFVVHQEQTKQTTEVDTSQPGMAQGMHARPVQTAQPQATVTQTAAAPPPPPPQPFVDAPVVSVASAPAFEPEETFATAFGSEEPSEPFGSAEEPELFEDETPDPANSPFETVPEAEGSTGTDPGDDPFGEDPFGTDPVDGTVLDPLDPTAGDPTGAPGTAGPITGIDGTPGLPDATATSPAAGASLEDEMASGPSTPDDLHDVSDPAQV